MSPQTIGAMVMFLLATCLAAIFGRQIARGWATAEWRQVPGVVDSCELKEVVGTDGQSEWEVYVRYHFEVDGRRYEGTDYAAGNRCYNTGDEGLARAMARGFARGETVPVFVNPRNSSDAVLQPGLGVGGRLLAILIIALCVLGIGMVLRLVKVKPFKGPWG